MIEKVAFTKFLKWSGITVGAVAVLMLAAYFALNSRGVQNALMRRATTMLSEQLQTRVAVDSVSVTLLTLDVALHGVTIEDRQQRPMLRVGLAQADADLWRLLHNEVIINNVSIKDVNALLIKEATDSVANYQFVIDAFAPAPKDEQDTEKMSVELRHLTGENLVVTYNDKTVKLGRVRYNADDAGNPDIAIHDLAYSWQKTNRKGVVTHYDAGAATLSYRGNIVTGEHLTLRSDNRLPRKNTGKPNRGWFDAGHLDLTINLKAIVDHAAGDSLAARLEQCTVRDSVSGIDLREVRCALSANRRGIDFSDVVVRQVDTEVRFDHGKLLFADHDAGTPLTYSTSTITGDVHLLNISRAFSPALRQFTLPLKLSVVMTGNDDGMSFTNIRVNSVDHKFAVAARGSVAGLRLHDSHAVKVHFDVERMTTTAAQVETIIHQFPVKRFMMKQLQALGAIRYTGSFDVLWRRQLFRGRLMTAVGSMNFAIDFDHNNKYLSGSAHTDSLAAGVALGMPDIGYVAADAKFKIDISKERTAALRKANGGDGGKLPIGEASAHISHASYKFVKTTNLDASVESNGAVAQGKLVAPAKFVDLGCSFTFTNTDNLRKMKIKPLMSVHKPRKNK